MASTITHTQIRSQPTASTYQVQDTVTATTTIDDAVFTFNTIGGTFSHVCTVLDMLTYPDNQVDAANAIQAFYRQPAVTKVYSDVKEAQDFAATLISRMTSLASEYDLVVTAFLGTTTETLPP
jgi:hypothetical protein